MIAPQPASKSISHVEEKLGWAAILLLLAGCLLVMRPFVSALLWAVVLCSASWPLYGRLLKFLNHRRTLAATLMTLGMVLIMLLPFVITGTSLADNVKDLTAAVRNWIETGPPQPPEWLAKIPLIGDKAVESWENIAGDTGALMDELEKWLPTASTWLLKGGLLLGHGLLQLALSIFIAFFLFRDGTSLSGQLTAAVERIASDKGLRLLAVAHNTIRGVVYGILGTAFLQAVLLGIGLLIAGVPGAGLLALLTFFCSILPVIGTGLVSVPAALWLFHQGSIGLGIFMLIWGAGVGALDNVVKPWLISQGSDLPFLLIFFGVIGGIATFGFIGVFLGPSLLAVGFRIIKEWASITQDAPSEAVSPGAKRTEQPSG
jgi:predicted PurR-regulated permease PerM